MNTDRNAQFEQALPRLLDAYDHGRLVPFLGAGASVPACPLWQEFVENLERLAGSRRRTRGGNLRAPQPASLDLIRRAADAVRRLKNAGAPPFAAVIQSALQTRSAARPGSRLVVEPPVSAALARIWWPLVLTTNYDDWFYALWNKAHSAKQQIPALSRMEVVGRESLDCQRVLNSLNAADNPLLWALHGFVCCQKGVHLDPSNFSVGQQIALNQQVIVGHEEYRRQVHNSLVFRRAFGEVFRSRSLLFLGTSLSDPDFLDLFDEILELHGPNPHSHFALLKEGSADARMLNERLQIRCVEYPYHTDLPKLIERLGDQILAERPRAAGWSYNMRLPIPDLPESEWLQPLHILRGKMPKIRDGECAALDAGLRRDGPDLGRAGHSFIRSYIAQHSKAIGHGRTFARCRPYTYLWRAGKTNILLVTAQKQATLPFEVRDARSVALATEELMQFASQTGFRVVHAMLQASGSRRAFPPHVSLIQMVRGFAQWRKRTDSKSAPCLVIHVVHPVLLHLLESQRLNIGELLTTNDMRFWLEIWRRQGDVMRFSQVAAPDQSLSAVLECHDIPGSGWTISVHPSPTAKPEGISTREAFSPMGKRRWTVASVGLLPGSTLRVTRDAAPPGC